VLVLAAAIGAFALITGDDDEEPLAPQAGAPAEPAVSLDQTLEVKSSGIEGRYPEGWRRSAEGGTVTLESRDRCIAMALGAPGPAAQAEAVRRQEIDALQGAFSKLDVRPLADGELGGRPSTGALVAVRNRAGDPVVVRVSVAEGKRRAYLVETVYRRPPCEAAAAEANAILQSLRFTR
jgi:hypothetical protein